MKDLQQTSGTDLQALGKTRGHRAVPCPSEQEQAGTSNTMAIGTRHEGSQVAQSTALLGELQRLATGTNQIEASPPATIQAGMADDLMKLSKRK